MKAANADQSKVRELAIHKFVDNIHLKSEFFGIAKHMNAPSIRFKQDHDPQMIFMEQCRLQGAVALPTLSKIKDRVLKLRNYSVNMGLCQGLGHAFNLHGNVLKSLCLESSGVTDEMLAVILAGLLDQHEFKSFTYKKNQLDTLSVGVLVKLLKRPVPFNLDELRLIDCKIKAMPIQTLQFHLATAPLRRLALVKAGVDSSTIRYIIELV